MILTPTRLAHFREVFFRKVSASPYSATLLFTTVGVAASALDAFVGSSPRTVTEISLPALYVKNVSPTERTKYGLSDNVTGILYLSPNHLLQLRGTFRVDHRMVQVNFFDHLDNVESVSYDEDLFDTCVAVVLGLRSATPGA